MYPWDPQLRHLCIKQDKADKENPQPPPSPRGKERRRVDTNMSDAAANGQPGAAKKKLILNAFVESCSGHQSPGLWQHPDDQSADFNDIKHWVKLAQLLEKGGFHGMFIADVLVCSPKSAAARKALHLT